MIEFGKTLREAREAKGLSIAQVADATHMMSQIVEGLEKEDFSRIVAPIYGRGFVKLYCETVGLPSKELVAEFMEIYSGNRSATIRIREVQQEESPDPPPTPSVVDDDPFFKIPPAAPPTEPAIKRTFKMPEVSMPNVPPSLWRMTTLAGIAIVVLWVAFIGIRALYRATMSPPAVEISETKEAIKTEKKRTSPHQMENRPKKATGRLKRDPMSIPPLYVD